MSNNSQSPKFAQTIPLGVVSTVCAIGAVTALFQNLGISCLLALTAVGIGIVTLRMQVEKVDKTFAMIGVVLSVSPIIYAIVIFARK